MKFRAVALILAVALSGCAIESGNPDSQEPSKEPTSSTTSDIKGCKEVCRNHCPPKELCTMICEIKCPGEVCGNKVCGPNQVCCNPLMGICTAPGDFCAM